MGPYLPPCLCPLYPSLPYSCIAHLTPHRTDLFSHLQHHPSHVEYSQQVDFSSLPPEPEPGFSKHGGQLPHEFPKPKRGDSPASSSDSTYRLILGFSCSQVERNVNPPAIIAWRHESNNNKVKKNNLSSLRVTFITVNNDHAIIMRYL